MSKVEEEIESAMKAFMHEVYDDVRERVGVYARALIAEAVANRQSAPRKHNFTGNLLNSIVVCVYEQGRPWVAYYPSQYGIVKAIRFKMTRPRKYHFKRDYDGDESTYKAEIETNQGWGVDDAREFFEEFRPSSTAKYCIVVAYPTEYASFVESYRHTTGFVGTYTWAKHNGWNILQLPWTDEAPSSDSAPF